jgi:4-amino-4-deoxy-L-arabinose transferase-like glycosyltransferase
MGGQISWLLPAALIALAALVWLSWRRQRTDRVRAAALLWGGWLVGGGLVLSFMSGISHTYYVVALTPAIGALVGIGAAKLWEIRATWFARVTLALTLLVTGVWAWVLLDRSPGWYPWLRFVIIVAAICAACLVLAGFGLRDRAARGRGFLAALPVSLALIAGLGGPLAYSIDTAATAHTGASPSAGPIVTSAGGGFGGRGAFAGRGAFTGGRTGDFGAAGGAGGEFDRGGFSGFGDRTGDGTARPAGGFGGLGGFGGAGGTTSLNSALAKLLETGASGYKWAAATVGSDSAASLELGTGGVPVMAIGGFSGTDPTPTLAAFEQMVASHEVHYFVAGGTAGGGVAGGFAGRGGTSSDASQVTSWVEAHFTAKTVGGETIYDLTAPKSGS